VKVPDDELLRTFRLKPACECCGRRVYPLEVHHCFVKRGMGGARRIDLSCNLIALTAYCHRKAEHSPAFNETLKAIIAAREGTTVEAITDYLNLVIRTPKEHARPPEPWKEIAA
jgi:hypothetical protein